MNAVGIWEGTRERGAFSGPCGTRIRWSATSSGELVESRLPSDAQIAPHDGGARAFTLLVGGRALDRIERREGELAAFHTAMAPEGALRALTIGRAPAVLFSFKPSAALLSEVPGLRAMLAEPRWSNDPMIAGALLRALGHWRCRGLYAAECAESAAIELGAALTPRADPVRHRPPWLDQLVERLEDAPLRPASARALAESLDLHPVYVARVFRRHMGCSVAMFTQRLRLIRAAEAIVHGRMELAEAAVMAGFADQSHLGRVLRMWSGMTPGALRRLAREVGPRCP